VKIRFPILAHAHWSKDQLWWMEESNGDIKHYMLLELSVMDRYGAKAIQIVVLNLMIGLAWIGWKNNV
jgi:hypothetical protein